ncbi:neuromedin U [Acidicapsa ligni]|uniref:neuromedin U n=1 Tax=Acidicapsa ligni TaxID=542300 RepID=UPI0021E05C32|nr:neuromedin U [Acidicapsa ligni]
MSRTKSPRMQATYFTICLAALALAACSIQAQTAPSSKPSQGAEVSANASASQSEDAAAKDAAQNPVAAAISVPFQNNTYYDVGPYRRAENQLLIEPVIPIKLSDRWIVISRTITPVVVVPRRSPGEGVDYGLSNIQPQFYLSPAHPGKFIWGVGPQLWLPTATDKTLGTNKWGGGPALVGLIHQGHWLGGSLLSNQFAGVNHTHVNQMLINPFLFYNMKHGYYFVTTPVITADWTQQRSQRWTVPVGGGVGRVFKVGPQPLNARAEFFNNVRTTNGGSSWQMQVQLQFLFIQKKKR